MGTGLPDPRPAGDGETLDIRLLGGLQVRVGGEPLEVLRSGRARSLLAFLVLHAGVAHSRQRLAFEFWPDSSEAQARTNLRNVLHTLRRAHPALDAGLRVTSTTLQWRPVGPAAVDVDRFVVAAEAAVAADPDDAEEMVARCRAALGLYGGELLAGDHDEWLVPRRDVLHDQYRGVMRLLATALIDDGRPGEATPVARDLVRADPLDESGHRLRIEAHHAAGDRAGAVRAYHECVATLERELGVQPGRATTAAYAEVLDSPVTDADGRRDPRVRAPHDLVGREREWQQLVSAWDAAQHGPPAVVLVTGEPGIGKTRLVEELRAWCARSGAAVAEARSYATEGDLGYGVVAGWLRSPDIRAGLRQLPGDQRADLSRLLPELGSPSSVDGADEERRRRLFEAAAAALTVPARPTLLVADDCQWSDQVSQEFIHYLIRQPVDGPLLVVLTARREELDSDHPMTALRDSLAVLDRLVELPLPRLSRAATGEVARQVAGARLDDEAIETLFSETEGNPLFVVETMRAGWDGRTAPATLSPRLRAVIDARFHRLSQVAADVLALVAVVGRPCSADLLASIGDLDDRSLARGLDELWRRGILHETGTDSYEFSHGKLRDAAYENLSPALRRAHHAAVAQILARLADHDPELAGSQIASHFEAANRPEQAVVWLQRAALDAQLVAAYVEAVRLLDRALALVPALPAHVRHTCELELLSIMPVALGGAEGYATTRMQEAHRRATDVAASLGVDLEPVVARSMVMSALCRDEFDEAAGAAGQLLELADTTGDAAVRMEAHYLLGISAFWGADLEEARRHFEIVTSGFDPLARTRHHDVFGHDPQVVCHSRLANTLWFLGREDDARRACEDALGLADEVGHPLSHDTAAIFSCLLALDLGDHEMLRRLVPRLGTMGMDTLPFATKREAIGGLLDALDGNHAAGITRIRAALERCGGRNFYPGFQATITRILIAALAVAGDAQGGLRSCEQALELGSTPLWLAEVHRVRADILHATAAEPDRIDAALQEAEAVARRQGAAGHLRRIEASRQRLGVGVSPVPT